MVLSVRAARVLSIPLAILLAAPSVFAQDESRGTPAPEGAPPAATARDEEATSQHDEPEGKEDKSAASDVFAKGRDAFMAERWQEALGLFRKSYELKASANTRLMIAKSLQQLSRPVEAYLEMNATLREATRAAASDSKYEQAAEAAKEGLEELRGSVAIIRLRVEGGIDGLPSDASIRVGDRELARREWSDEVVVEPGATTITLTTTEGFDEKTVSLRAGGDAEVSLSLPHELPLDRAPKKQAAEGGGGFAEHQRTIAYVVGGVGAAGMVLFAVFGGLTLSSFDDLGERCPAGECPRGTQNDIDKGKTYQTVANVSAGVGAVGLTAGVLLWVLHPDIIGSANDDEDTRDASVSLSLGAMSIHAGGRF